MRDAAAEADVLGLLLHDRLDHTELVLDDFEDPHHRRIFGAVSRLRESGVRRPFPKAVAKEADADLEHYVGGLVENAPTWASPDKPLGRLHEASRKRRLLKLRQRIGGLLDEGMDSGAIAMAVQEDLEQLEGRETRVTVPTAEEFLAQVAEDEDWLVEGVLRRKERLVLTGAEGMGKSTMLRAWGWAMAAGRHPWFLNHVPPIRVTLVDLENTQAQLQDELGRLAGVARTEGRFRVKCRTSGLDLRANGDDQRWLLQVVRESKPDVLILGPHYKLSEGSPHDEEEAKRVAFFLDRLRERYGCALLLEAHAGHGEAGDRNHWRPFGASLWMRWPEFGFGLAPPKDGVSELRRWRGLRDRSRRFPTCLTTSATWPWTVPADELMGRTA